MTHLRWRSPICGFLRFSAKIFGFLWKSAVFSAVFLRPPNDWICRREGWICENLRFSAKICVLGPLCHLSSVPLSAPRTRSAAHHSGSSPSPGTCCFGRWRPPLHVGPIDQPAFHPHPNPPPPGGLSKTLLETPKPLSTSQACCPHSYCPLTRNSDPCKARLDKCRKWTLIFLSLTWDLSHNASDLRTLDLSLLEDAARGGQSRNLDRANGRGGFGSQTAADPPPPPTLRDQTVGNYCGSISQNANPASTFQLSHCGRCKERLPGPRNGFLGDLRQSVPQNGRVHIHTTNKKIAIADKSRRFQIAMRIASFAAKLGRNSQQKFARKSLHYQNKSCNVSVFQNRSVFGMLRLWGQTFMWMWGWNAFEVAGNQCPPCKLGA